MSFYQNPHRKHAHVVIFYRDFADYGDYDDYGEGYGYGKCHRGMGINALMTAKVLRKHGIRCDIIAVKDANSVPGEISKINPTHAIFQALWISGDKMAEMCTRFPSTQFIVRTHSQIGFLQVEPNAIKILRDLMFLQDGFLNLTVSSNTHRLKEFLTRTYKSQILYLPNLYDMSRVGRKMDETHHHKKLRIGSFGAHRTLKNHTTAAAAALMIAERRNCDLEFYINAGRKEGADKDAVFDSLQAMFNDLMWAKIVEVPWGEWSEFRHVVAHMDLCMQISFTETFNIVTADAICEGTPSVVSHAIEWAPEGWKAAVDDASEVARVGAHLLWDTHGAVDGFRHLEKYQHEGIEHWLKYLDSNPTV